MIHTLKIKRNTCAENPANWDNVGVFAYKHSNYCLGKESIDDPIEWLEDKLGVQQKHVYTNERLGELEDRFFDEFIALPVYLHSGITISTTPFSCRWDSGKVGYIYVSKKKIRDEFSWKIITKNRRAKILQYLENEIELIDQYLRGDVYGFEVEDVDGNVVDSCWGFYGDDWENNGIKEYIDESLWEQLENIEVIEE